MKCACSKRWIRLRSSAAGGEAGVAAGGVVLLAAALLPRRCAKHAGRSRPSPPTPSPPSPPLARSSCAVGSYSIIA